MSATRATTINPINPPSTIPIHFSTFRISSPPHRDSGNHPRSCDETSVAQHPGSWVLERLEHHEPHGDEQANDSNSSHRQRPCGGDKSTNFLQARRRKRLVLVCP